MRVSFEGSGWGLGGNERRTEENRSRKNEEKIFLEGEERTLRADSPEQLPAVLAALDEIAASGNPTLLAAGFVSYEAGVFLEGSAAFARPHEFLPFAEFSVFDTRQAAPSGPAPTTPAASSLPLFTFKEPATAQRSLSSNEWSIAVGSIRDGIARGDVYQVNLSSRSRFPGDVDPFSLADALYADNPVPYAVTLAGSDWAVVSNSPELFLDVDLAARRVVTKPIKGTIARAPDEEEDARRRAELLASAKDAAENVMIVDLLRNDLGKVAEPGRVETTALRALRSFRHLHHLESAVQARLRPSTGLADVLRATLPGGSITGAPKRAALRFIHGLEPVARGAYCGAAGFVRGDGRAVLNVAIRTALVGRDKVDYHAGSGIVWDSRPDAEWREMESKSREFGAAMAALAACAGGKVNDGR
ncbi:MAG: chorismate-binding protein [Acidobacteriota bacterium]